MPKEVTDRRGTPRFEELLARAEALIPVLRERAPRAEQLRRLPDETIADLHSSGLFRILQPARVGGSELPFRALFELTAVIGRGCGSTAGCCQSRRASLAPRDVAARSPGRNLGQVAGQPDQLGPNFRAGPRPARRGRVSADRPLAVFERNRPVDLEHVRRHRQRRGDRPERAAHAPAPGADYTVIDTWQVIGLAGTGSKDVEVKDVSCRLTARSPPSGSGAAPIAGSEVNPGHAVQAAGGQPVRLRHRRCLARHRPRRDPALLRDDPHPAQRLYRQKIADFTNIQVRLAEAAAIADAAEAIVCAIATRRPRYRSRDSAEHRAKGAVTGATVPLPRPSAPGRWISCSLRPAAEPSTNETRSSAPSATSMRPMPITS